MVSWFRCHLGYCLSCEMGSLGKGGMDRGDVDLLAAPNFLLSSFPSRHLGSISQAHSHDTFGQTISATSGLTQVPEAGTHLPRNLASSLFHDTQIFWRQNPYRLVWLLPRASQHQTLEAWLGCVSSSLRHFGSIPGPGASGNQTKGVFLNQEHGRLASLPAL